MWQIFFLLHLLAFAVNRAIINVSRCPVIPDDNFPGFYFMNCTRQNLTLQDVMSLYHAKVATLDLSENNLKQLPNNSLAKFTELRSLICMYCRLEQLHIDSLKGLENLQALHLNFNYLKILDWAFPHGMFVHVPHLKELYIDSNDNTGNISKYSNFIDFDALPELTDLAIDSFMMLSIHEEFLKLRNLRSLHINCSNLLQMFDDSFKGFKNSTVKELELSGGEIDKTELGLAVFQYLPNVSFLSLNRLRIGNANFLRLMKPLERRQIDTIRVASLYSPAHSELTDKFDDAFVTVESMKHLGTIRVSNFYWFNSHLYSVDGEAFFSPTWRNCLKTCVLQSDQMLDTDFVNMFRLMLLKKIKQLSFSVVSDHMMNKFVIYGPGIEYKGNERNRFVRKAINDVDFNTEKEHPDTFLGDDARQDKGLKMQEGNIVSSNDIANSKNLKDEKQLQKNNPFFLEDDSVGTSFLDDQPVHDTLSLSASYHNSKLKTFGDGKLTRGENSSVDLPTGMLGKIIVFLPPTLETLFIDGFHVITQRISLWFMENSITSLGATNGLYVTTFHGNLYGLNRLTTIDLEGTKLDMKLDLFDTFPSLKNLNLRRTARTPDFLEKNCKRIVENIPALESLNIAENDLTMLSPKTFHTSRKLKYLNLAKNRFSDIPFDLEHTPMLEVLDLRGNVFSELSLETRRDVGQHIKLVPNFTILLSDNILSCSCAVFPFIVWLRHNQQHFENDGNFSCLSQEGKLSYTAFHSDIAGFWRHCKGGYYLMLSLTMLCALLAGYSALFLGMKRKTQIISFFMRVFVPGFRLKSRQDFSTDVFIGYANQDVDYVRNVLLRYLEDLWHLRTFVHSRDLLTDPLLMTTTLEDSWRCLLIITENFLLNYEYSYNIMKVASFFVGPTNPKRVVLIVEERVQHRLPAYLLQVVDEDNILIVPHLQGSLDDQALDTLRTLLMT